MSHLATPQVLCTACRVRPATVKVGHWPVCGKCGGRSANDVLGIRVGSHMVGELAINPSTNILMYGLGAILLGIAAILIVND